MFEVFLLKNADYRQSSGLGSARVLPVFDFESVPARRGRHDKKRLFLPAFISLMMHQKAIVKAGTKMWRILYCVNVCTAKNGVAYN
jgi:hypothetical protein